MTSEMQRRIDQLGEQLRRSVVLNDPDVRLMYASQHYGDEDPVRIRAALHRDAGARPIAYLLALGVDRWTAPGRIPANPELGLLSRLLVPVRWRGELLGTVVVIDADESLTTDEVASIEYFATEAAGLIVAERHTADLRTQLEEESTASWLSRDPATRQQGTDDLNARGLLPEFEHVRVLVASTVGDGDETRTHMALRHAFTVVRSRSRGVALAAVREQQGLLALVSPAPPDDDWARETATTISSEVRDFLGDARTVQVGIGEQLTGLNRAWLSRQQAELALRGVPLLGTGQVATWGELGPLQVLLRIPPDEVDETVVPAPVAALIAADTHGRLVETLLTYLRLGGAGSATAAALHIHRTTLYYRLDQVRQITGLDIDDGDARLVLHLGLEARRLLNAR